MSTIVIETPKRYFLTRNDVFWRISRKNPFKGVGCSLIEAPKKTKKKTSHPKSTAKSHIWGSRNPWTDRYKILHVVCRPGHDHASQFWWSSVKGIWCGEGSHFGLFYRLGSSPLKHSRTTVRVCDVAVSTGRTAVRLWWWWWWWGAVDTFHKV